MNYKEMTLEELQAEFVVRGIELSSAKLELQRKEDTIERLRKHSDLQDEEIRRLIKEVMQLREDKKSITRNS